MDTAKVISRSNSDLSGVELLANNRAMSPTARMEAIYRRALDWHTATVGTVGRAAAVRECDKREGDRTLYT